MPSARAASGSLASASRTRAPAGSSSVSSEAPARSRSIANRRTVTSTRQILRRSARSLGLPARQHARRHQPADRAEQVTLPRDPLARLQPAQQHAAPYRHHHQPDRDLPRAPVEPAARDQVGGEPEDDSARAHVDASLRRDEPGAEPAHERDDREHCKQPARPLESNQQAHDHEWNGVREQVREADVQERRGHDSVEPVGLARLNPVPVELVIGDHVHHLDGPHQRHQRQQDLSGVTHRPNGSRRLADAVRSRNGDRRLADAVRSRNRILDAMATAPDQKPSIAPIVGPDDERRFTDSGIEIKPRYAPEDVAPNLEERLGEPGEYPFTRGIHPDMYRGRKWTMRQYAGYASAKETNERFHYLIDHGSTGLSMAFDLPTQLGRDSDDPLCMGEVGRTGVAIDTIDAPAAVLLLLYELVGEEQGVAAEQLRGTTQNDVLKEYIARGNFIYPPGPAMRLTTDLFAYCRERVPNWNTISISGYHMREKGCSAVQEVAFTLANAIAYVQAAIDAGLQVDEFGPRLAFFFNGHNNVFQ